MVERRRNPELNVPDRENCFLMVVDSDVTSLYETFLLLRKFEYQAVKAKTAGEALQMAAAAVPYLVITALGLKDMNGLELMRNLKHNPNTSCVPFITLRKHNDQLGGKRSLEYGAVDCLEQPVSPEQLYRAVQTAVEPRPRANIRIRTLLPVKVNNEPLAGLESAWVSMLSERGMFLRTPQPAAVDTRLSLQIDLNRQTVPVEAIVIYSDRRRGESSDYVSGMGLKFVQLAPTGQELIRQFIRNEIMRDIAPSNA